MTRNGQIQREIEALSALVDRFGADRTRWPAPERLRFAGLLKDSAEARRLLTEAAAFDRLLDMAPLVDDKRQPALVDRIVATAVDTEPQVAATAGRERDATGRAGGGVRNLAAARAARTAPRRFGSSSWPAAALLAASLALGIFAGSTGLLPAASFGLGTVAADSDFYGRTLALGPDVAGADEETL